MTVSILKTHCQICRSLRLQHSVVVSRSQTRTLTQPPIQSPPGQNIQTMSSIGGHKMGSQHLDWVQALIYDVKSIQSQVSKIDNIEKAMNKMCTQIHDLEVNVGGHNYRS